MKIKYCFIRDVFKEKEVDLVYYFTKDQLANLLTKALLRARFEVLRALLGVSSKSIKEENVKM